MPLHVGGVGVWSAGVSDAMLAHDLPWGSVKAVSPVSITLREKVCAANG